MQPFTYERPASLDAAFAFAARPGAMLLAGGTTMVDVMRGDLSGPSVVVDIGHLDGLSAIEETPHGLRLGALARMADAAEHPLLLQGHPALAESLQLAASQQLRNAATLGGNLLQRTRCVYYRDGVSACNKRAPGSGCAAQDGITRDMAIFGGSDRCIATYPGDWATALAAFDTTVELRSAAGTRTIPFAELHVPYGEDPAAETRLRAGEIITAILVAATPTARASTYVKLRDRHSYAYAVVSAVVALDMDGGTVREARVSLGGVADRPWRSHEAEAALTGQRLSHDAAMAAGHAGMAPAHTRPDNDFKRELGARVIARAVLTAATRT